MGTTTVLVCNHKGGVGKTMLSVHLAAYAANHEPRTLAIDTDPQGTLADWHVRSKQAGQPFPDVRLMRAAHLREEWADLRKRYAAIVIDTPPSMSSAMVQEFAPKVDLVVVPVTPSGLDLHALATTMAFAPAGRVRLVLNRWDQGLGARDVRRELEALDRPISVVRDYVAFRDASLRGGTVISRYPHGNAAYDVRKLGQDVWS